MPRPSAWQDLSTLLSDGVGSQLLGFLISFVVIAVFWRLNVQFLGQLTGMDSAVLSANIVTAGLVIFIPFTTQGISDSATADLPLPTALYAVNITLVILSQMTMLELARRHGLLAIDDPPAARSVAQVDALITPAVFLASIPVAYLVNAELAKYMWLLLAVIAPISGRLSDARIRQARIAAGHDPVTGE